MAFIYQPGVRQIDLDEAIGIAGDAIRSAPAELGLVNHTAG